MTFDELKEKAHALPLKPGVYIMQDAQSTVIYVGKAKAVKNRVSQYFANLASHTEKTRAMVSSIDHFDVIVADSEFEALVLENSLIKRHQPHYNILLKDDKGYPYIRLDVKSDYPRFSLSNRVQEDGARYFGPYGSRGATYAIVDALREALKLPSCGKKFPRDIGKERPCLNYHMGLCDGYCRREVPQGQHQQAQGRAPLEVGPEGVQEAPQGADLLPPGQLQGDIVQRAQGGPGGNHRQGAEDAEPVEDDQVPHGAADLAQGGPEGASLLRPGLTRVRHRLSPSRRPGPRRR